MMKKLNLKNITTVKELKDFINDLPDNTEFDVCEIGDTGYVGKVEFEYNQYENLGISTLDLNIEAESGYHY